MRIRAKLVMYFTIVALLAPILGIAALNRVDTINSNVQNLADNAIPLANYERELERILLDQQNAALAFALTGRPEDRQRYLDGVEKFTQTLNELSERDTSEEGRQLATSVREQRARFNAAGAQLLTARTTLDRNRANLDAKNVEIVQELSGIRKRFVPTGANAGDATTIPVTLRNQINDLLLGTEGMLHYIAREAQIVSTYALAPSDQTRKEFETASATFNNWLQLAYGAGGPDDRAILVRVQNQFAQYESSARAMMAATDLSASARNQFTEAGGAMFKSLEEYRASLAANVTQARDSSASAVDSASNIISIVTVVALLLAGVLGVWFAGTITRPIRQLRDVADKVSTGDIDNAEVNVDSPDEIGDLANAFRRMVASIRFLMTKGDDADDEEDTFDFPHAAAS